MPRAQGQGGKQRVTDSAVGDGTGYTAAANAVGARLFPDKKKFDAEEARRFALLDEHWDVIIFDKE